MVFRARSGSLHGMVWPAPPRFARYATFLVVLHATAAGAAGLQADPLDPQPAGSGVFGLTTTSVLPAGGFSFDLWLSGAFDPVTVVDNSADRATVVPLLLRGDLVGAVGLGAGLEGVVALPVAGLLGDGEAGLGGGLDTSGWGLGDLRLQVGGDLVALLDERRTWGVGASLAVWAPTGDEARLQGEGGWRFEPRLTADLRARRAHLTLNLAWHVRESVEVEGLRVDDELRFGVGAEIPLGPAGLAAELAFLGSARVGDADAAQPAGEVLAGLRHRAASGLELGLAGGRGARSRSADDAPGTIEVGPPAWRLLARVGWASPPTRAPTRPTNDADLDGVPDARDVCPYEPELPDGVRDEDGCPEGVPGAAHATPGDEAGASPTPRASLPLLSRELDLDADGDGLAAYEDDCPDEPEDADGFEDYDGCPEADDDGDGVADADDACPRLAGPADARGCPPVDDDGDGLVGAADLCPGQPETHNGYADEDGCPDEVPEAQRDVTGVVRGVRFGRSSARLLRSSWPTLQKLLRVLRADPQLHLEVVGHTDARGDPERNRRLSAERAGAIARWLEKRGIEAGRVTARGVGAAEPVAGNETARGRARNRRVEFRFHLSRTHREEVP